LQLHYPAAVRSCNCFHGISQSQVESSQNTSGDQASFEPVTRGAFSAMDSSRAQKRGREWVQGGKAIELERKWEWGLMHGMGSEKNGTWPGECELCTS